MVWAWHVAHRFMCLNTWPLSAMGWCCLGRQWNTQEVESCWRGQALRFSVLSPLPVLSLLLDCWCWNRLAPCSYYCLFNRNIWISQEPWTKINPFPPQVVSVKTFYRGNRKVRQSCQPLRKQNGNITIEEGEVCASLAIIYSFVPLSKFSGLI